MTSGTHAYEQIRARIISLELPPGFSLRDSDLAVLLGCDLGSVQEALRMLAQEGLVEITPRQQYGTYVTQIHLDDLDQLSETRMLLEEQAARLAALRITDSDLEALEALLLEQRAYPVGDPLQLLGIDHRFHQGIAQAARNLHLARALDHYFGLSQRLWTAALPRLSFLPAAVEQHAELLEALRARDGERAALRMRTHVQSFYEQVRAAFVARVEVAYGGDVRSVVVEDNSLLAGAIIATGLPLEQPCAGRGTCLKCKVMAEGKIGLPDASELEGLSEAERKAGYRLACRARVKGDVTVTLAPVVVYSNKSFRACDDYKRPDVPLGLAIDLGSTTVAAFLTTLSEGRVCAGAAVLNQQTAFGADVVSRMAAALRGPETAERVQMLALSSIMQATEALRLPGSAQKRIQKVTVVGNCAMHHLLLRYPVHTLAVLPFQPFSRASVRLRDGVLADAFPSGAEVILPPLIGGFVGSDALACLVYYGFDQAPGPMAAIDLGTNGEVMVTDGRRIAVASTAAGPAFEGVNISCGTRAVDGAIVHASAMPDDGSIALATIGDAPPVGLTGSGLLELVLELRRVGVIEASGRFARSHPAFGHRLTTDERGVRRFLITDHGVDRRGLLDGEEGRQIPLYLTQHDVREVQKAKGAIRAATEVLMARLDLRPDDLQRMILTGSFGSQLNVDAVLRLGMIPPLPPVRVEPSANGAGFGAAQMLQEDHLARGEELARRAEQIDLDQDALFNRRYVESMALPAHQMGVPNGC